MRWGSGGINTIKVKALALGKFDKKGAEVKHLHVLRPRDGVVEAIIALSVGKITLRRRLDMSKAIQNSDGTAEKAESQKNHLLIDFLEASSRSNVKGQILETSLLSSLAAALRQTALQS